MLRRNPLVLVACLAVLAGCSEPVSHAYTTQAPATTAPAASTVVEQAAGAQPGPSEEPIVITGRGFDLHTAGRVGQATFDAAWAGVLDTLNRYLEAAVLTPLRTGGPAGDLTPLFTPLSVAQVMTVGPDRFAFIDENLAPVTDLRKLEAVATLTALGGPDGTISVVTANLQLRLTGRVDGAPLALDRTGELVLMPEGGTWRIDAWDVKVTRRLASTTTTTAARS
ncbi:MAG: hypothetical protein M3203_01920 [Actinomycetota bacterium]|nr:hypothetical protein [Actinomycetota bacterium]